MQGRRAFLVGMVMSGAAGLALAMKPTQRLSERGAPVDLEAMIPKSFGGWRIDTRYAPIVLSPELKARLDDLYNQTLSRTYIDDSGASVMLSIAYGGDQSNDATQVHRPEFCYVAQGFQLIASDAAALLVAQQTIPVRRLLAVAGLRSEPITYWVTIGDKATLPGFDRKLLQLRYGLTGAVPDGMLVRVSSLGTDAPTQYALQERFIHDLLAAVEPAQRVRLIGAPAP